MLVLPHTFIRQRVDVDLNPVAGYALIGVGIAFTFVLFVAATALLLIAAGKWQGDMSGVGGVMGFMVMPFVLLAGLPWSLVALKVGSNGIALFAIIAGLLINGAIIGAVRGYVVSRRRSRES